MDKKIEWNYVKEISDENLISKFEKEFNFIFPSDFKENINFLNGGRPVKNNIEINFKGRIFQSLLSFNPTDLDNIWDLNLVDSDYFKNNFVAFGLDPFGNLFVFSKDSKKVGYYLSEVDSVEYVADNFSQMIEKLED
ncbi:MAG: SMI1/KNR4 family protein [Streptococcaceae bacterium]|nr:SMI1/KNR4 family protein [Streptococcaceae bacterium]